MVSFDRDAVEKVIKHCESLAGDFETLRDRAFVLTLADSGLRISKACSLKRGDVDWVHKRCVLRNQYDKKEIVYFSDRSIKALNEYLNARTVIEPNSINSISSQPLFARHDIRASRKIRPITAGGMWKAIKSRIEDASIERNAIRIHDFRHYFTVTYLAKRDLKLTQVLARHENISATSRYAHFANEADTAYDEIFNKK